MFAVIYRAFVYPHCDEEYRQHWKNIADYFTTHCGAIGSTLKKQFAFWLNLLLIAEEERYLRNGDTLLAEGLIFVS